MPRVGGKSFAYTAAGKKSAAAARKKKPGGRRAAVSLAGSKPKRTTPGRTLKKKGASDRSRVAKLRSKGGDAGKVIRKMRRSY